MFSFPKKEVAPCWSFLRGDLSNGEVKCLLKGRATFERKRIKKFGYFDIFYWISEFFTMFHRFFSPPKVQRLLPWNFKAFGPRRAPLLLTAAVGIGPTTADNAYDVPALNQHMDFINLMTYDMCLREDVFCIEWVTLFMRLRLQETARGDMCTPPYVVKTKKPGKEKNHSAKNHDKEQWKFMETDGFSSHLHPITLIKVWRMESREDGDP